MDKECAQTSFQKMTNRYKEKCSGSLAIRKMQIKTTVKFYFTLVRMAIIQKSNRQTNKQNVDGW